MGVTDELRLMGIDPKEFNQKEVERKWKELNEKDDECIKSNDKKQVDKNK